MRFRHPDGTLVHLAYCTNVHPAEHLDGIIDRLDRYAGPVRRRLGTDRLGVGLWLAAGTASALAGEPAQVRRLRRTLDRLGLEVVTLNGFPYAGFQNEIVKHRVYHPDWTRPERVDHTLNLARILTGLLPDDVTEGSISTLPLAWRTPWRDAAAARARSHQERLERELAALEQSTGRSIAVAFEPEPGCVVETTAQAAEHLLGGARFSGVCLDACHLAVAFEEPEDAVARLAEAGLAVPKMQASCALHVDSPADPVHRDALSGFAEPRFLHQTRERGCAGGADDLDEALRGGLPGAESWRVHFHIPLHARPTEPLRSTQRVLIDLLRTLLGGERALTRHVEVETYTWNVLPDGAREPLADGIAAELHWIRERLAELGLREE